MVQQVKIKDVDVSYDVDYRDIRYPRLEFKTGALLLVLPKDYRNHEELIEKHKTWIYYRSTLIRNALKDSRKKSLEEKTDEEFRALVHSIVEKVSGELKLNMSRVYFRKMKSKWGSCSSKKNLTINTLLRYLPRRLIEYVIYHEMAHLIERNHNERYWNIISKRFNNFQRAEKDLLVYWFLVQNLTPLKI